MALHRDHSRAREGGDMDTVSALHPDLAQQIGLLPAVEGADTSSATPSLPIDWALYWHARGLHIFPCKRFLGTPIPTNWYKDATDKRSTIIEWWSTWELQDADLAAVPERSGHFVIAAYADEGGPETLDALEDNYGEIPADISYETRWGDVYLWLKGCVYTRRNALGPGVHTLGSGQYVFL